MSGITPNRNDQYVFYGPDGDYYPLSLPPRRSVLAVEGEGIPPINYVTQRFPLQHGVTPRSMFLDPRVVKLVVRQQGTSRVGYQSLRDEMLNYLRPNRAVGVGIGTLRKYRGDGTYRDLDAIIQSGPLFEARDPDRWDEWGFTESLYFVAHNPIYYNPTVLSAVSTATDTTGVRQVVINYTGTWEEYPTIIVRGKFLTGVALYNVETGARFESIPVLTNEIATFTLSYNSKAATNNAGTSIIGYVSGDFGTFHLHPGTNTIRAVAEQDGVPWVGGTDANSRLTVTYRNRYIGI